MLPVAKRRRTSMSPSGEENAQLPDGADEKARKKHAAAQHKTQLTAAVVGEMQGSYKSNVFRMETEEMLSEVAVAYGGKRMKAVEGVLHCVKALIDAIPDREGMKIAQVEQQMMKRKIHIPFPEPRPEKSVQYTFAYKKPAYGNVAGSFALKTLVKGKDTLGIDLVLTMPSELFSEKDYLNHRYFYKRAYYLSVLADGLGHSHEFKELKLKAEYDFLNGDQLKPVLVVSSNGEGCALDSKRMKCVVNIIPSAPPGVFPTSKLFPFKNCVRPQQQDAEPAPTPFYNASLAAEATYFPYLAQLHSASGTCAAFADACVLGRIWLRQRGFGGAVSSGGFGHFEWAVLQAFLLKGGGPKGHGLLATGYSNYQMFKAMLQFLAARNLVVDPLVFGASENVKVPGNRTPVVFDGEHAVNVLFKMTSWSYNMLRHEAQRTLETLGNATFSNQFDSVFLQRLDEPCYKFDAVVHFPFPSAAELEKEVATGTEISGKKVQYADRIYKALREGLTDRVTLIHLAYAGEKPFNIKGRKFTPAAGEIVVGLLFNAQNVTRSIDRGPSPEEKKKAAAFRKFWGSKAELRRFPDGSIIESVTWPAKSKTPVYQQIVRYILSTHFGKAVAEGVTFVGDAFNHLLEGGEQGATLFQPTYDAFNTLEKDINAITDIPLAIRHISGAAPSLRAASIDIPLSPSYPLMDPANVVVQFESSTRWPQDLVAIQKTKASFLLRLGQLLEAHKPSEIITRVGLENEDHPIMNYAFLDIIYPQTGAAFRVRIYHDREAALLENRRNNPALSPREREAAEAALVEHKQIFVFGPRHTDSIRQLCHRYPHLSPTIRVLKRWFSAQLLGFHIPEELIELLAARTFLCPQPYAMPGSIMSAFLRSLQWLAKWDWRKDPLFVDFTGESKEDFRATFEDVRRKDPALNHCALWVGSSYDLKESVWTMLNRPAKVVAARMTALARAADAAVKAAALSLEPASLFVPATGEFDFVLQLRVDKKRKEKPQKQETVYKNLQLEEEDASPVSVEDLQRLDFLPAREFVHEISKLYQNTLLLFPCFSTGLVGGVWVPINPRRWKANVGFSSMVLEEKDGEVVVAVNKPAVLNEICRIGGEIVRALSVR
ncbi:Nrap protein [Sphaerosporella brunnea]|uniref:U3 small nucleolar RNA-associated protein 22 n=1 Tax=Sphaerosporella brunnea TaxID=1250544 RepID=A0A5J5EPX7_9PEZI|nr:Nrap protein [Sphaerosporella brunnea]